MNEILEPIAENVPLLSSLNLRVSDEASQRFTSYSSMIILQYVLRWRVKVDVGNQSWPASLRLTIKVTLIC